MRYVWFLSLIIILIACSPALMDKPLDPIPDSLSVDDAEDRSIEPTLPTKMSATKPAQATEPVSRLRSDLPDLGPAPELKNEVWLNTDKSLRLADLRGKVVLIDMWTFG